MLGGDRKLSSTGRVRAVTGTAISFVALWSSVTMSQPAKAYRISTWELLHLPAEELRRLEREGRKPKPIVPTIDISKITAASQLALISISGHPICDVMTRQMRSSTARFNVHDFAVLRDLDLAQRAHRGGWHRLTDAGKHYAPIVAQRIAIEAGIHAIYSTGRNIHYRTTHCTCGWSTRLYSTRFSAGTDHEHRVIRHLAQVADAMRPRVEET